MITEPIEIDAGPAIEQLHAFADAAEEAAGKVKAAFAGVGKDLTLSGGGADKLAASMSAAADRIEQASQRAAASMGRLSTAGRAASGGLDSLAKSADAAGAGLDRAAEGADASAAALDKQAVSADRSAVATERTGKAAAESGGFFSRHKELILGTALALGYGVDKAMQFNSTMTMLGTQANVNTKWIPEMSTGVLQLAGQVGFSPNSLAESLYHVASNMATMKGASPVKMLEATKIAAEGAAVGHSNLVDTTTALTSVLASGIKGSENYSKAMGFLNATVGTGEMTMQDLAEAMGTGVVPVVKGYGLTLKDVGAALATYGDLNIRGAKAGTDLRMAVQALSVPAKAGAAELKALGLNADSLAKDMQSGGLLKAVDDLTARFEKNGITAKNEGQVITELFGKKAGVGLALLLENMDRFHSKFPALQADANNFGQAWATTLDTPQQKLRNLEAGAQALAITAGNVVMPAASAILGGLDKAMQFVQSSPLLSKTVTLGLGTLVAGGLAKGIFSGVESGLAGLGKIGSALKIPGLDKLAGLGQSTGLDASAAALDGSAANLDAAAAALKGAGAGGAAGAAGKAEGAAAGGAGAGAAEGAGAGGAAGFAATVRAAAGPAILGVIAGEIIRSVGDQLAPAGSQAGRLNASLQQQAAQGGPASQLHPYVFGGLESKAATSSIGLDIGAGIIAAFQQKNPLPGPGAGGVSSRYDYNLPAVSAAAAAARPAPAKVPPPDMSGLDLAQAKARSAAQGIEKDFSQVKAKIPPPDMSGLDLAKAKTAAAMSQIDATMKAAAGPAKAAGDSVAQGMAAGITAGTGAAVAAAHALAAQVEAALNVHLQVHSPSRVTQRIGAQTVEGLIVGLEGGQPALTAAATALGKTVAKAADVTSIDSAITKAIGYAGKDSALVTFLKADQSKLLALAARRTALETEIADSQQIAQQQISNMSIMNAGAYTPAGVNGPQAAQSTIQGMQYQAADQKAFAEQLAQAKAMGLNAQSLSQIAQSGAAAGLPILQGLTGPGGGKAAIAQINALEKQIVGAASKIGDAGGPAMYQAGVQLTQGLAQGLKSELAQIDSAISSMAKQIVDALKKKLKISSPSGVGIELGLTIPQGVAVGIDGGSHLAAAAMLRMGGGITGSWKPSFGGWHGGGSAGGGGTVIYQVTIAPQGSLVHQNDLMEMLQGVFLAHGSNNWQMGTAVPGKAR